MGFFSRKSKLQQLSAELVNTHLANKNVLIIGGTAGIGRALAISCINRKANVTIVGRRNPDQALENAKFVKKDLSSMKAAIELSSEIDLKKLDVVVFSNGIITTPERKVSEEGIEMDLAVSFLSRFAFCSKWDESFGAERADTSKKPRVFVLGYPGKDNSTELEDFNSEKVYKPIPTHLRTVVCNEALVTYLANKFSHLNVYGLNPGLIHTEIRDNYLIKGSWLSSFVEGAIKLLCQSAERYSENVLVHALVSAELEDKNKALLDSDGTFLTPNSFLDKDDNQNRLMKISQELLDRALSSSSEKKE